MLLLLLLVRSKYTHILSVVFSLKWWVEWWEQWVWGHQRDFTSAEKRSEHQLSLRFGGEWTIQACHLTHSLRYEHTHTHKMQNDGLYVSVHPLFIFAPFLIFFFLLILWLLLASGKKIYIYKFTNKYDKPIENWFSVELNVCVCVCSCVFFYSCCGRCGATKDFCGGWQIFCCCAIQQNNHFTVLELY